MLSVSHVSVKIKISYNRVLTIAVSVGILLHSDLALE